MKKLGILVNQIDRSTLKKKADTTNPLIALSYTRSGFIRLAGLKKFWK
ncbi:MAG: hypothetical protein JEZ02_18335 [Desulfatibacillum sp.]|nr:hypothetical protein [Desulfatibacillum sp.]